MQNLSIRVKLLVIFLILALVPMTVTAFWSYQRAETSLTDLALHALTEEVRLSVNRLTDSMEQLYNDVLILRDLPAVQGILQTDTSDADEYERWVAQLNTTFAAIMAQKQIYQQLRLLDETGLERVRVDYRGGEVQIVTGDALQNKGDRGYFLQASTLAAGEVAISPLNLNQERGQIEVPYVPVIRYSTPLYDEAGQLQGVLVSNVYASTLLEQTLTEDAETFLINQDGYYLAHPDPEQTFGFDLDHEAQLENDLPLVAEQLAPDNVSSYANILSDLDIIVTAQKIYFDPANPTRHWIFLRTVPESEVLAAVTALGTLILTIGFISTMIVVGAAFTLTQLVTDQLTQLTKVLKRVEASDFSKRVEVTSGDEIGQLAQGFNELLDRLQTLFTTLTEERDLLQNTVHHYVEFARQVAEGDLSRRLDLSTHQTNDVLLTLGENLNLMVGSLSELNQQIRQAAADISGLATEITAATAQQSTSSAEQSSAIAEISATIQQVQSIVHQTQTLAKDVATQASQTQQISENGQTAVSETVQKMLSIKEQVSEISSSITTLNERAQQIEAITLTVNEFAIQSNLLALNASIEAARAGEQGRGFAVVAAEVRSLAEQSKQATAQVKSILAEIQQATQSTVKASQAGLTGVNSGVNLTEETGDTISMLAESILKSTDMAQQIAVSTDEQTSGIAQLAVAMQNIEQGTRQNLDATQKTEESAEALTLLAQSLEHTLSRYKLS